MISQIRPVLFEFHHQFAPHAASLTDSLEVGRIRNAIEGSHLVSLGSCLLVELSLLRVRLVLLWLGSLTTPSREGNRPDSHFCGPFSVGLDQPRFRSRRYLSLGGILHLPPVVRRTSKPVDFDVLSPTTNPSAAEESQPTARLCLPGSVWLTIGSATASLEQPLFQLLRSRNNPLVLLFHAAHLIYASLPSPSATAVRTGSRRNFACGSSPRIRSRNAGISEEPPVRIAVCTSAGATPPSSKAFLTASSTAFRYGDSNCSKSERETSALTRSPGRENEIDAA